MKTIICLLLLVMSLVNVSFDAAAQFNPEKVCRVEDGQLIFTLNLKWTEKEKKQVAELYDLDSLLVDQIYKGVTAIPIGGEIWTVKKLQGNLVEVSKSMTAKPTKSSGLNDVFLILDQWANFAGTENAKSVIYGVNDFDVQNAFVYRNGIARFYLPSGKNRAQKVYISGTFNNWSTTQTPMKFVANGWMIDLKLKPGKYAYKFIVDGQWITDPSNNLREYGGEGSDNSVVYCYNHEFILKGFSNARKVVVTGNFFNWNKRGIALTRTTDGWSLPMYLRDGTYLYKFLVDGKWVVDPANKSVRVDLQGNVNSQLSIGESYLFKLKGYPTASKVVFAGDFNGWNDSELLMEKTADGWQIPYVLAPGNYEYKFIADGKWLSDPSNPFTTGSGNYVNSFIALKANHIFELTKHLDAKVVVVTGSFNGWKTSDYRMIREGAKWIFPIYLAPGKYTYKFIVDGKWILDPVNKLYEPNEYGTDNTVLWIDQPN